MPNRDLAAVLIELEATTGQRFNAETFDNRLRIQKSVYLLGALGHPIGEAYPFNDYFHGPYSPPLAQDYYELQAAGAFRPGAYSRTGAVPAPMLRAVGEAVCKGNDFLEALATLHSLASSNPGKSPNDLFSHASLLKPQLRGRFEEAWTFLTENGFVAGPT